MVFDEPSLVANAGLVTDVGCEPCRIASSLVNSASKTLSFLRVTFSTSAIRSKTDAGGHSMCNSLSMIITRRCQPDRQLLVSSVYEAIARLSLGRGGCVGTLVRNVESRKPVRTGLAGAYRGQPI